MYLLDTNMQNYPAIALKTFSNYMSTSLLTQFVRAEVLNHSVSLVVKNCRLLSFEALVDNKPVLVVCHYYI